MGLHRKSAQNACVVASNATALQLPDVLDGKRYDRCWRPEEESVKDLMVNIVAQSLLGRLHTSFKEPKHHRTFS